MSVKAITREDLRNRRQIAIAIVLVVALIGLLAIYYLLTRPPRPVTASEGKGYTHLLSIYGNRTDRLSKPVETAVGPDGNIYVADTFKHRVVVFRQNGTFVTKFGKRGTGRGDLDFPNAIAVDKRGFVFVANKTKNKIVLFDKRGRVVWEINIPSPQAMTVVGTKLYVATPDRIMIGTTDGKLITSFGGRGRSKGKLDFITGIAVSKGRIVVADSGNYRVQAFNQDGEAVWVSGKPMAAGKGPRSLYRKYSLPAGLAADADGNIFMVDAFAGQIVVLNPDGRELMKIGTWGHDDGQFYYPSGISYIGNQQFAIADKFNNRVQVFRIAVTEGPSVLLDALNPMVLIILLMLLMAVLVWQWYRRRPVASPSVAPLNPGLANLSSRNDS
ncbi:MAG: 6-bladed beta-propeller [Actinomycetota bacterium]|nr:6-bladed beta-propeller [Actinomycetota bacterium]